MSKVIRIAMAVLAVAVLSLLAAMPLLAAWRISAQQHPAPMSIDALELMQQSTDRPGQRIQGLSLVY
jgi:hypothetical protein